MVKKSVVLVGCVMMLMSALGSISMAQEIPQSVQLLLEEGETAKFTKPGKYAAHDANDYYVGPIRLGEDGIAYRVYMEVFEDGWKQVTPMNVNIDDQGVIAQGTFPDHIDAWFGELKVDMYVGYDRTVKANDTSVLSNEWELLLYVETVHRSCEVLVDQSGNQRYFLYNYDTQVKTADDDVDDRCKNDAALMVQAINLLDSDQPKAANLLIEVLKQPTE